MPNGCQVLQHQPEKHYEKMFNDCVVVVVHFRALCSSSSELIAISAEKERFTFKKKIMNTDVMH